MKQFDQNDQLFNGKTYTYRFTKIVPHAPLINTRQSKNTFQDIMIHYKIF